MNPEITRVSRACSLLLLLLSCSDKPRADQDADQPETVSRYLNHHDSARYVGMDACRSCHQEIYNTFIKTGMGRSFELAGKKKSAGDFTKAKLYDRYTDFYYEAFWHHDSLYMREFRTQGRDTLHNRVEQVNYIIGSGQHTNSHLQNVNGYLTQMPMTYYTQKGRWDLPPGFENGINTRFSRKIGIECISCHNAIPGFVKGSENKFTRVPQGIDCERCHGPGSIHVAERSAGSRVDTSRGPDYSIVNPARLSIDEQFDICQRCHLQGNAVLKEGKTFLGYRPGEKLSDYFSVFLPKYSNSEDEFIMASHADRLKQSPCFIRSLQLAEGKAASARPYKNAMTCITCHDPHVSVKETSSSVFNQACLNCHAADGKKVALQSSHKKITSWNDCVKCHMPLSGSVDIPHVTIHDHFIRKPVSREQKEKIKEFLGLYAVNERSPDVLTRAKAYLSQYEKFEQEPVYLDSAKKLLNAINDPEKKLRALIQLGFIRKDYPAVIALINKVGEEVCLEKILVKQSVDNEDGWTAYRVAESFLATGDLKRASTWFRRSAELCPYNPDFLSKHGTTMAALGKINESIPVFEKILAENPRYVPAYTNLGYLKLVQGFPAEAMRMYTLGEKLDPDNETLLLNISSYFLTQKNILKAKQYLQRVISINPQNVRAQAALRQLNNE
jgi:tetratricopeptide (TPR) repeat protein